MAGPGEDQPSEGEIALGGTFGALQDVTEGTSDFKEKRKRADEGRGLDHKSAQLGRDAKGCFGKVPVAVVALLIAIIAIGGIFAFEHQDDDDETTAGKCGGTGMGRTEMVLIACVNTDGTTASTDDSASASDSSSSSGGTAGGGTASVAPPDQSSLPPGAILFQGQTGDNIGPIAADGLNRFVSLTAPGVSVGNGKAVEYIWDKGTGTVVSFGSNLHTGNNKGRYGFAVFRNTDQAYTAGCAIEVGTTSCQSDREGQVINNGDSIVIIIGEAGTGVGDYSADWWFVFQPT